MERLSTAIAIVLVLVPACGDDSGGASSASEASSGAPEDSSANDDAMESNEAGLPPDECDNGPLDQPIGGCAPEPLPSTGDPHADCVARINQLRAECQCLPPLQRWTEAESCTNTQSSADQSGGGPHGNFGSCGESAQNTCPDWPSEDAVIGGCLQAMWDEGPGEPFSEHGHYINMSSREYTKVACGFSSSSAGVWSNQNFSR